MRDMHESDAAIERFWGALASGADDGHPSSEDDRKALLRLYELIQVAPPAQARHAVDCIVRQLLDSEGDQATAQRGIVARSLFNDS